MVGADDVGRVRMELRVADIVVALDRRVLDRTVHPHDLEVRPGVMWFGQPMIGIVTDVGKFEVVGTASKIW